MAIIETEATIVGRTLADGIHLSAFGPAASVCAAALIDSHGSRLACILSPTERSKRPGRSGSSVWDAERETDFRDTALAFLRGLVPREAAWGVEAQSYWIVFDPEQSQAEAVAV